MESTGTLRVVLAGLPNAGKSTLFNALVGDDAAIVSARSGTTRDAVRADVEWDGVAIELFDTAGWEAAESGIAGVAGRLRSDVLDRADLVLWCRAPNLSEADRDVDARQYAAFGDSQAAVIPVATKSDLVTDPGDVPTALESSLADRSVLVSVSAHTGEGLSRLASAIREAARDRDGESGGLIATSAARCRGSLEGAIESLDRAADAQGRGLGDDLVASEIREALDRLGEIVGAVYTDDLLDRIFSKFCIGK